MSKLSAPCTAFEPEVLVPILAEMDGRALQDLYWQLCQGDTRPHRAAKEVAKDEDFRIRTKLTLEIDT